MGKSPAVTFSFGEYHVDEPAYAGWPHILGAIPDEDEMVSVVGTLSQFIERWKGGPDQDPVLEGLLFAVKMRGIAPAAVGMTSAFIRFSLYDENGGHPTEGQIAAMRTSDVVKFAGAAQKARSFADLGRELKNVFGPWLARAKVKVAQEKQEKAAAGGGGKKGSGNKRPPS